MLHQGHNDRLSQNGYVFVVMHEKRSSSCLENSVALLNRLVAFFLESDQLQYGLDSVIISD